jgi:hypothetical protein
MASKLEVYNASLALMGQRELESLSEGVEPRRVLDRAWDRCTRYCLEQGFWAFATRAIEANAEPSIEPTFGFTYAFQKPNDFLRVAGVWSDSNEIQPLTDYAFEQEYFYANGTPIYIRYVSSDPEYGMNVGEWPESFSAFVEAHLAAETCTRITADKDQHIKLRLLVRDRRLGAVNNDTMNKPARFPPMGGWARSRSSSGRTRLGGTGRGL